MGETLDDGETLNLCPVSQNEVDICVTAANSLTWKDHDPEAVAGEPGKLFWPVCVCEESEWRPVRAPVLVLV